MEKEDVQKHNQTILALDMAESYSLFIALRIMLLPVICMKNLKKCQMKNVR